MRLVVEVECRECVGEDPCFFGLVGAGETERVAQVGEYGGSLVDYEGLARFAFVGDAESGRCEGGRVVIARGGGGGGDEGGYGVYA